MDDFEKQVQRILQTKSKSEIQRAIANSPAGKSVHQCYLAALQKIEADESRGAADLAETRHRESLHEARTSRRIAHIALILSAFAFGIALYDRFFPRAAEPSPRSSPPPHTESMTAGLTAPIEPDATKSDE